MKKTTTQTGKKLLLTTEKVRDLRPLSDFELDHVVGGAVPSTGSGHGSSSTFNGSTSG